MPPALTPTQRNIVTTLLDLGRPPKEIAERVPRSHRQVTRMRNNFKTFGTYVAPKLVKQGRAHKLTLEVTLVCQSISVFIDAFFLKALGEFLQQKPSAYLDE